MEGVDERKGTGVEYFEKQSHRIEKMKRLVDHYLSQIAIEPSFVEKFSKDPTKDTRQTGWAWMRLAYG